ITTRLRCDAAPVSPLWLLIAFSAVQPIAWSVGVGMPQRVALLIPLIIVWVALVALAALATQRITSLSTRLSQKEKAHDATLSEVDQLQTQNAMLDIIAPSIDLPPAFPALPD